MHWDKSDSVSIHNKKQVSTNIAIATKRIEFENIFLMSYYCNIS